MTPADRLEQALAATAQALEAGDAVAAEEASGLAARATADLAQARARLDPERLRRCAELQARCEAAAGVVQRKLAADLGTASRSARASAAYRRG